MERLRKIVIDAVERLLEFLPRNQIQLRNRLLRIRNRLQQIIALPRQERKPLLALVVLLQRHHVHRAHRFDARLHLTIIRLRDRQLFPADERGLRRDQVLRLRVHLRHASLAQVLPVGIIPRTLHFRMTPLLANFLQRLPPHAQPIFHLCDARPSALPFLLQLLLSLFQPQLLRSQALELLRKLLALRHQRRSLFVDGSLLLPQRSVAPLQFRTLFHQPRRHRLGRSQPLIHRRELRAPRGQLILLCLDRPTQLHQLRGQPRALRFRLRPRSRRSSKLMLRALRT